MTLSDRTRLESLDAALRRMLEELGELWIGAKRFAVDDDHFSDLPQTTWLDLKEQMWVRTDNNGGLGFKLTGAGLVAAMRASGELSSAEHKQRCVTLRSAFKVLVKGRELEGGRTDTWTLVAATGLPDNWIFNAMDARFLAHEWPRDYVDVDFRSGGRDIRVPANFGMQRPLGMEAGPILPIQDF